LLGILAALFDVGPGLLLGILALFPDVSLARVLGLGPLLTLR
jgi:hypothetical protein